MSSPSKPRRAVRTTSDRIRTEKVLSDAQVAADAAASADNEAVGALVVNARRLVFSVGLKYGMPRTVLMRMHPWLRITSASAVWGLCDDGIEGPCRIPAKYCFGSDRDIAKTIRAELRDWMASQAVAEQDRTVKPVSGAAAQERRRQALVVMGPGPWERRALNVERRRTARRSTFQPRKELNTDKVSGSLGSVGFA